MEGKSLSGLLWSAVVMTLALIGMSMRWELARYIAPFGDVRLTPLLFLPLLLVSIFSMMAWFGLEAILKVMGTVAAWMLLISCVAVGIYLMAQEPTLRWIVFTLLFLLTVAIGIVRYRQQQIVD